MCLCVLILILYSHSFLLCKFPQCGINKRISSHSRDPIPWSHSNWKKWSFLYIYAVKPRYVLPVLCPNIQHWGHNSVWQERKRRTKFKAPDAASAQLNTQAVTTSCSQATDWHCGKAETRALIYVFAKTRRVCSAAASIYPFETCARQQFNCGNSDCKICYIHTSAYMNIEKTLQKHAYRKNRSHLLQMYHGEREPKWTTLFFVSFIFIFLLLLSFNSLPSTQGTAFFARV